MPREKRSDAPGRVEACCAKVGAVLGQAPLGFMSVRAEPRRNCAEHANGLLRVCGNKTHTRVRRGRVTLESVHLGKGREGLSNCPLLGREGATAVHVASRLGLCRIEGQALSLGLCCCHDGHHLGTRRLALRGKRSTRRRTEQ